EYSKFALHLWTNHLAWCLSEKHSKVLVLITQPGIILSDGAIRSLYFLPYPPFCVWSCTPDNRGDNFVACTPLSDSEIFQGAYIYRRNIAVAPEPIALDEYKRRKLVEFTGDFLQSFGV
ncbi:hypothetical protein EDD18DRAFT_1076196, partial [Armillaria luteobubalina]